MGFPQVRHCGLFIGLGVGVFFSLQIKIPFAHLGSGISLSISAFLQKSARI